MTSGSTPSPQCATHDRLWRVILESIPDAILVVDSRRRIVCANLRVAHLFGYAPPDLEGRDVQMLIPEEQRRSHGHHLERYFHEPSSRPMGTEMELRGLRRDETTFPVDVTLSPLRMDGEKLTLVVVRDATERTRTEETRRMDGRLEAVRRLAGGIAHEFNNIFTTVFGTIELVFDELPDGHPLVHDIGSVRSELFRGRELIQELLLFSQRTGSSDDRTVELNRFLTEFASTLRSLVTPRIELRMDLSDTPLHVGISSVYLEEVLFELMINATDVMDRSGRIEITTTKVEQDPVTTGLRSAPNGRKTAFGRLEVRDSGPGVSTEDVDRLFDPFFSTRESGTGMGLSVVHGIVTGAGGCIDVVSGPADGTTFVIDLPLENGAPLPSV